MVSLLTHRRENGLSGWPSREKCLHASSAFRQFEVRGDDLLQYNPKPAPIREGILLTSVGMPDGHYMGDAGKSATSQVGEDRNWPR